MVVLAWVFFRSLDITHALTMIKAMLGIQARPIPFADVVHGQLLVITDLRGRELALLLVSALAWVWLLPNSTRVRFVQGNLVLTLAQAIATVCFLYLAIDRFGSYSPFLYFQF
jgi:alginate O-acetyltransferase complex protein AlgI